jgi:integrase
MAKNKINFTKPVLENLPLPEKGKRDEYYDTKIDHLLLRVSSTGRKTFQLYRWFNGSPERITIGLFPNISIEQARNDAKVYEGQYAQGDSPADKKRKFRREMTFGELFHEYMERHAKLVKKTWQQDQSIYDQYLDRALGKKKLSKISRKDIAAIHSNIGKDHRTRANRVYALMSVIFSKGIEYGLWENLNPCQGIKKFSEKSRDRFLGKGELPRFFQALNEEPNATVRDYFLVSLLTGARRANVLGMRWSEISFDEATWRIPVTKNGEPQTVTLGQEVIEILRQRQKETQSLNDLAALQSLEGTGKKECVDSMAVVGELARLSDIEYEQRRAQAAKDLGVSVSALDRAVSKARAAFFVFPSHGKTGHLMEPKKGWKRLLARAGLEDLRIHDLRRTMGSWQAKTGASLAVIGKSLNHKNQSTTAIYARLDIDPVRESMEKATAAILEAVRQGQK